MPERSPELDRIAAARQERERAEERVLSTRRRQAAIAAERETAQRRGDARRVAELDRELEKVKVENTANTRLLDERRHDLAVSLDGFSSLADPTTLIERWDDRIPILLLPVRVEVRFMPVAAPTELWVRIFPDDIAVHTHEPELTASEASAGQSYWESISAAAALPEDERGATKTAAWRSLAGASGGPRAAWIARQTNPDSAGAAGHPEADNASGSWGRAPRSNVMPDRFAVILQAAGRPDRTTFGNQVVEPLVLGPDPSAETPDIEQVQGEIRLSEHLRWMHEFDEALKVGMAVRVPLTAAEANGGFDRLFVLGLRLSSDPDQSRRQIETLIDNHHYSPDGAGFIPQGTPTNNTADSASGFRSLATEFAESEAVEVGEDLFTAVDDEALRGDGQRLAEALGIAYTPLTHLQHAGGQDIRESRLVNQALWPATLGYYLEQMLGVDARRVRQLERFFVEHVAGRGPLPAIRVGSQPYGVLLTSDLRRWRSSSTPTDPTGAASAARDVQDVIGRVQSLWERALDLVSFAGKPGDSHAQLLNILGLNATSVDYFRRHAVGSGFLWNYATFLGWGAAADDVRRAQAARAQQLLGELGLSASAPPPIVNLTFFSTQSHITDPIVADIPSTESERLSETDAVRHLYKLADSDVLHNYISWLLGSSVADIKAQIFRAANGDSLPVPRPLLYRLLRHALLLANVDAALQLYEQHGAITALARREEELPNVRADRTVTRWEFLEARVDRVLPQLSSQPLQVVEYLATGPGQNQPAASGLARVRSALEALVELPTARLERLLAEHVDLCSYRLDGWQTALFAERLRDLRDPQRTGRTADRAFGLHLGAFGWLEDVRPGVLAVPVDPVLVPEALREPDAGGVLEQPDSGGAVHALSTTHAVAAAVLRNAYLTHASPASRDTMSIDLSSERVRLATSYLHGIAQGQSLGALLGYQFQRGLKERHGDPSLAQFIQNFRDAYPLRADKITADSAGNVTALKEANNVFDGYLLLERTLLAEPPTGYPYGVKDLPPETSAQASAIREEVDRMAATMDAVGDLALTEGVYQVAQGNFDRSSAMVQAIARGTQPPEPEVARTPRTGVVITHRVALHLDPGAPDRVWSAAATARSRAEPSLNAWLGERLGDPSTIRFVVKRGPGATADATGSLADLALEPIDLVHIAGDEMADGESELVRRIRHAYREHHGGSSALAVQTLSVEFPPRHPDWGPADRSAFEMLPLIAALKHLATAARPLGAGDYMLPSEDNTNPGADPNPQRFDDADMDARLNVAMTDLSLARDRLALAIAAAAALDVAAATPGERSTALTALVDATRTLAPFGFPDAFVDARATPEHSGSAPTAFERALAHHLDLGASVRRQADQRLLEARRLKDFTDLDAAGIAALTVSARVERYRDAARQLVGSDFNLLPRFTFKNSNELIAAATYRDQPLATGLLRHAANPLVVEEWFQGTACVRERLYTLETVATMGDAFASPFPALRALQLPFRDGDHWVGGEYPPAFRPVGDFVSIVQHLPASGFDPGTVQTGLLIDAWTETIPNRIETTGIAVHYNQPNAHPPQTLLLAVAPELTGTWKWEALVGILSDTLHRAKLRAVEPDQIGTGALGQFLPAILTPTASRAKATVTADLLHQTADAFADPGGPGG